jgi:hypothetical protein
MLNLSNTPDPDERIGLRNDFSTRDPAETQVFLYSIQLISMYIAK